MYFIYKQDVVGFQIGKYSGQIACPFYRRSAGDADINIKLFADEVGQRCFTQSGRAIEEDMLQCLFPFFGCRYSDV